MGLSNAPGGFQRYMESILRDMRNEICIPYINDLIMFSRNFLIMLKVCARYCEGFRSMGLSLNHPNVNCSKRKYAFQEG